MSMKSLQVDPPVRIRIENCDSLNERAAIRAVNEAAFGGAEEADLVDRLRADGHVQPYVDQHLSRARIRSCSGTRRCAPQSSARRNWQQTDSARTRTVAGSRRESHYRRRARCLLSQIRIFKYQC
jgi:hypothetical protein